MVQMKLCWSGFFPRYMYCTVCAHNATNAICRHRKLSFVRMWRFTLFLGQCTKIIMVSVPDMYILLYLQTSQAQFFLCRDPDYFWDDVLILEAVAAAAIFLNIFLLQKSLNCQFSLFALEWNVSKKPNKKPHLKVSEKKCAQLVETYFFPTLYRLYR